MFDGSYHGFLYANGTMSDLDCAIDPTCGGPSTRPGPSTTRVDRRHGTDAAGDTHALLLTPTTAVALPGDANCDGKVDVNDLTIVLAHFGQTGMTWSQGEFTGDGTVDINDLTIVLANYNQTAGAGVAAVPEPGPLAILAAGLSGLFACASLKRQIDFHGVTTPLRPFSPSACGSGRPPRNRASV